MIEIRPDQIQIFLDKVRSTFVNRVSAYLKANHANVVQALPAPELDALIRRQIVAAEGYGIKMEVPVVQFIEIGLAFGEDFHSSGRFPDAERILLREGDPAMKMQELQEAAKRGLGTADA